MKKPPRALQSEWAKRLKASGFEDLEGPGGVLSNRGNVTTGDLNNWDGGRVRQMTAEARAEAETYYDNARDIARRFHFRTKLDREVWTLHAERFGRADISRQLGIGERQVRESMARTRAAIERDRERDVNQVKHVNQWRGQAPLRRMDKLVRSLDVEMLVALTGALA